MVIGLSKQGAILDLRFSKDLSGGLSEKDLLIAVLDSHRKREQGFPAMPQKQTYPQQWAKPLTVTSNPITRRMNLSGYELASSYCGTKQCPLVLLMITLEQF